MNLELNYDGFENNLLDCRPKNFGIQYRFKFDNDRGASVVKSPYSYGSDRDLWELAVLWYGSCGDSDIDYDTEITDDVLGYLTDNDVRELLTRIKDLEKAK